MTDASHLISYHFSHPEIDSAIIVKRRAKLDFTSESLIANVREHAETMAIRAIKTVVRDPGEIDLLRLESVVIDDINSPKRKRFMITGIYSSGAGDGGTWEDYVFGKNDEESEFQGKFAMAINELGSKGLGPRVIEIADFCQTMSAIEIINNYSEPVTKAEYKKALESLVKDAQLASLSGPALVNAKKLIAIDV